MIEKLHQQLKMIGARRQRKRFQTGLAITWWIGGITALVLTLFGLSSQTSLLVLLTLLILASAFLYVKSRRGMGDLREIAKEVERRHPELETGLLAALEQPHATSSHQYTYLQSRLIAYSLDSAKKQRWSDSFSIATLQGLTFVSFAGMCLFLAVSTFVFYPSPPRDVTAEQPTLAIQVEPGDVELEKDDPLTIQATFDTLPAGDVFLEITKASGEHLIHEMIRPFTDPVYQFRVEAVSAPMTYRVSSENGMSQDYSVSLYEKPALVSSEAHIIPPAFQEKDVETIQDPTVIRVIEGSKIDLALWANRPELNAQLMTRRGDSIALEADSEDPSLFKTILNPSESVRYEIVLTDSKGRRNGRRDVLNIRVTPNKPPVVRVVLPRQNDDVTPIQEVHIEAVVIDETGLRDFGLRYSLDGESWTEVSKEDDADGEAPVITHMIDLEAAGAQPNDIIMWNAWASDIAPDGRERMVRGDVQVIPVRAFDREVYQQRSNESSSSQQSNAAQGLLEAQKKILDATWGVVREYSEITQTLPEQEELETLAQSQQVVISMAQRLEAQLSDPSLRRYVTDARLEMVDAQGQLETATESISLEPLDPAIEHEQAALRHLYRLMSNRQMMTQSQGGGEGSQSSDRSLEDLDLEPMQSPYESELTAQAQAATEAQEAMEILSRLDALAKRLRDLNEEIKALQMAMNEAETEAERLENQRRLERLREQQRELLTDVDNLRDRSEAQASEDQQAALDQIRQETRRANQDLSEENLGDALAAGRRAQESVEQLQEEFKETGAVKLAQQLRSLREEARALEERQNQLEEQIEGSSNGSSLRSELDRQVAESIAEQRAAYDELVEALGETALTAEEAEPLVAKDLHEALREADQNGIAEALEDMDSSDRTGAAEHASESIAELTRQIENASERILGNEAQALRFARDEIQRLAQEMSGGPRSDEASQSSDNNAEQSSDPSGSGEFSETGENDGEQVASAEGQNARPGQAREPGQGEDGGPGQSGEPGEGDTPSQASASAGSNQPGPGSEPGNQPGSQRGGNGEPTGTESESGQLAQGSAPSRSGGNDGRGGNSIETGYGGWRERLEDLQAVIDDPEALTALNRAYRSAQSMRRDYRQGGTPPSSEKINQRIVRPLEEAARAVNARLRSLNREDPLAPINRDPVPERYEELVSRYFEALAE